MTWRKVWIGLKVALGIAIRLNDAGVIKVKELSTVKTIKDIVEGEVRGATKGQHQS
jgi:hypothetical protein